MTIAEKIIAHRSGHHIVQSEDTASVRYNLAVGTEALLSEVHDSNKFQPEILDFNRLAIVNGHLIPATDAAAGTPIAFLDEFSKKNSIANYFHAGKSGNCQTLLSDKGLIHPGDLIIGNDPNIVTYGALGALATHVSDSFLMDAWRTGEINLTIPDSIKIRLEGNLSPLVTVKDLSLHILALLGAKNASGLSIEIEGTGLAKFDMDMRFSLCNMIAETGAKFIWMRPDEITYQLLNQVGQDNGDILWEPDAESTYAAQYEIELDSIVPMAATPFSPFNGVPVKEIKDVQVDQVIIGGCNSGTIDDFRQAAKLLKKRKIIHGVKLLFFPPSYKVIRDLVEEELLLFFSEHGIQISPPSCSQCAGSGLSLLGENQTGLYTTNRNYRGYYGHESAQVYLAGTLVGIASAITGKITDPRDL